MTTNLDPTEILVLLNVFYDFKVPEKNTARWRGGLPTCLGKRSSVVQTSYDLKDILL
jgi:hypothetical protein